MRHSTAQRLAISMWRTVSHPKQRKNSAPTEKISSQTLKSEGPVCFPDGMEGSTLHLLQWGSSGFYEKRCTSAPTDAVCVRQHLPFGCCSRTSRTAGTIPARMQPQMLQTFLVRVQIFPSWDRSLRSQRLLSTKYTAESTSRIKTLICKVFKP